MATVVYFLSVKIYRKNDQLKLLSVFNKVILNINVLKDYSKSINTEKEMDYLFFGLFSDKQIYDKFIRDISFQFHRIYTAKNPELDFDEFRKKYSKEIEFIIHLSEYIDINTYWGLNLYSTSGPQYLKLDQQYRTALDSKKNCLDALLDAKMIDTTIYNKLCDGKVVL